MRAFAAVTLLLLAGCASSAGITLEQAGLASASGKDSKTLDCPNGKGSLTYDVAGTTGKVKIQVEDADSKDGKPMDKDDVSGISRGEVADLVGTPGLWTLTVDRDSFSGDYRVTLRCS